MTAEFDEYAGMADELLEMVLDGRPESRKTYQEVLDKIETQTALEAGAISILLRELLVVHDPYRWAKLSEAWEDRLYGEEKPAEEELNPSHIHDEMPVRARGAKANLKGAHPRGGTATPASVANAATKATTRAAAKDALGEEETEEDSFEVNLTKLRAPRKKKARASS